MKDLQALFKREDGPRAPLGLESRVLSSVARAAARQAVVDRSVWGGFFLASLGFFGWSVVYAVGEFSASAFGSYFSLIFSDLGSVSHVWRELGVALLESLPVAGVALVFASVTILLWSVRKYSRRSFFILDTHINHANT